MSPATATRRTRRVEEVLITNELVHRRSRSADHEAENRALAELAREMADRPQRVLRTLCGHALHLCRADSAGVSVLEAGGTSGLLRWKAVAGELESEPPRAAPRESSPCGTVLDRNCLLLFAEPERFFGPQTECNVPICEAMGVPFHLRGKAAGTLWVATHDSHHRFDAEDARMLTSLARFAAAGHDAAERLSALEALRAGRQAALNLMQDAVAAREETERALAELRQREAELREAKDAAEMANQSKDRFLAVLSHELRTPLTPVLMLVSALEHDPGLPPDVREDLLMVKRNVELEAKLIDDLLDLNRIATGKLILDIAPIDLNGIVRHVCGTSLAQAAGAHLDLETSLDESAGWVAADSARLQQVLWNVLRNAIKFTPERGKISVATQRAGDRRVVRVTDSGIGIAPEVLPRIFDAFEQGSGRITKQFGGLGLGLAISKALMELHGGSIRAESAGLGCGSTFIIDLPASAAEQASQDAAAQPERTVSRLRILLVEDHPDTSLLTRRELTAAGYTVSAASNVASALRLAETRAFDLLVSDLGLPDGTGHDVLRGVRRFGEIPAIAMSGFGMEDDVRHSREAGFSAHLVKPFDIQQLLDAIERLAHARA